MSIDPNADFSTPSDPSKERKQALSALNAERKAMLFDINKLSTEKSGRAEDDPKTAMLEAQKTYLLSPIGEPTAAQAYNTAKLVYEASQRAKPFLAQAKEKMGSERVTALNSRIQAHDNKVTQKNSYWKAFGGVSDDLNKYINEDLKKEFSSQNSQSGPSNR